MFVWLWPVQVECKKAQPKEVMLPANLAKTRAAGRGAYGELLMLNQALPSAAAASSLAAAYRFSPYTIPSSVSASLQQAANSSTSAAMLQAAMPSGHPNAAAVNQLAASSAALFARPTASAALYGVDMMQAAAAAAAAAAVSQGCASSGGMAGGLGGGFASQAALFGAAGASSNAGKRALAAAAAALAASGVNRSAAPALTYNMSELMGLQGLDVSSMYHAIPAAVGLWPVLSHLHRPQWFALPPFFAFRRWKFYMKALISFCYGIKLIGLCFPGGSNIGTL